MDTKNPLIAEYYANKHEERDLPYWTVIKFIFVLFLVVVATMVLMYLFFTPPRRPVDPKNVLNRTMTQPTLQPRPAEDMKKFKAEEQAVLSSYGWTDKAAGKVRIPVERAMEMLLQRGLPARSAP